MGESLLFVLLLALLLDWTLGEPDFLWSRLPHPVVVFGKAVSFFDRRLNRKFDAAAKQLRMGAVSISLLVLGSVMAGWLLDWLFEWIGLAGLVLEIFVVFALLAQKSLYDHVAAVAHGLRSGGLEGGRNSVAMIVGRDPATLDESGVVRASIESLAENFSDGVVAPAFWYAVLGLPGLLAYKMINTADSMIGYRNAKYLWFGQAAARIDDLANWLPARLSSLLIALGAGVAGGFKSARASLSGAIRDSGLHRSPNAGWPEAAMAAAINVALGGPRNYGDEQVAQAYLNASGRKELRIEDIDSALQVFSNACKSLWGIVGVLMLVSLVV